MKKAWIDLDNSSHVSFFAPIIEEVGSRVRHRERCFQVYEAQTFFRGGKNCDKGE